MKKIYVESLGCAKNQVDSEILLSLARKKGYEITDSAQDADVVVINTCGFIESAKKEAIDTFFSFRNALPQAKIVLAGCLAERYRQEIRQELPEVDSVSYRYTYRSSSVTPTAYVRRGFSRSSNTRRSRWP